MDVAADPMQAMEIATRLGAALGLSAIIGLERELTRHPAGLRTMMLVGLGSAVFVLAGREMLVDMAAFSRDDGAVLGDMSRIVQGVIGGIGFLGAGAILQTRGSVKGMTTAASIWVTAGLGVSCGLGLYSLAVMGGAAALFTLAVLGVAERRVQQRLGVPDTSDHDHHPDRADS